MAFPVASAAKQQAFLGFLACRFQVAADFADPPHFVFGVNVVELKGFHTTVVTANRALRAVFILELGGVALPSFPAAGHTFFPRTLCQEIAHRGQGTRHGLRYLPIAQTPAPFL